MIYTATQVAPILAPPMLLEIMRGVLILWLIAVCVGCCLLVKKSFSLWRRRRARPVAVAPPFTAQQVTDHLAARAGVRRLSLTSTRRSPVPVTTANLEQVFTYHAPTPPLPEAYDAIRDAAWVFAARILEYAPVCADQQAALRHVREAMMTANAAIALGGAV